jgi:hypothetical protein
MNESNDANQVEEPEVTHQTTEKNWPPDKRLIFGMLALGLWLILFAMGVLIPTKEYRTTLGWIEESDPKLAVSEIQKTVTSQDAKNQQRLNQLEVHVEARSPAVATPLISTAEHVAKASEDLKTDFAKRMGELKGEIDALKSTPEPPRSPMLAFLIASLAFMPLNIGLLSILAAYLGGCSVNKQEISNLELEVASLPKDLDSSALTRRLEYLKENPLYSAIRGLVVYLILISGLQIIGSAPVWEGLSDKELLTNYIKLAGLFSFFGYLAGYDPTVFTSMINFGSSRLRGDSSVGKASNPSPATPPSSK